MYIMLFFDFRNLTNPFPMVASCLYTRPGKILGTFDHTGALCSLPWNNEHFYSFLAIFNWLALCCIISVFEIIARLGPLLSVRWRLTSLGIKVCLIWFFSIWQFKLYLSGITVWLQSLGFHKLAKMNHFWYF